MSKSTAGPWFIYDGTEGNDSWRVGITIGSTPHGTRICDLTPLRNVEGREADARLIAASPDLLALARQYRDDLRHPPTADSLTRRLAAIDAVLAKVTGE